MGQTLVRRYRDRLRKIGDRWCFVHRRGRLGIRRP
jgi:hypothetical protein